MYYIHIIMYFYWYQHINIVAKLLYCSHDMNDNDPAAKCRNVKRKFHIHGFSDTGFPQRLSFLAAIRWYFTRRGWTWQSWKQQFRRRSLMLWLWMLNGETVLWLKHRLVVFPSMWMGHDGASCTGCDVVMASRVHFTVGKVWTRASGSIPTLRGKWGQWHCFR